MTNDNLASFGIGGKAGTGVDADQDFGGDVTHGWLPYARSSANWRERKKCDETWSVSLTIPLSPFTGELFPTPGGEPEIVVAEKERQER
mgnify:FL=1